MTTNVVPVMTHGRALEYEGEVKGECSEHHYSNANPASQPERLGDRLGRPDAEIEEDDGNFGGHDRGDVEYLPHVDPFQHILNVSDRVGVQVGGQTGAGSPTDAGIEQNDQNQRQEHHPIVPAVSTAIETSPSR